MYFVGIDISKYKHDCFIITESGDVVSNPFSISNNQDGFQTLLTVLNSLDIQQEMVLYNKCWQPILKDYDI